MNILLSCAPGAFAAEGAAERSQHRGHSERLLTRTLFELLSEIGDVTAIDARDVKAIRGRRFDLMVGVLADFGRVLDACDIARSVLFAVDQHPHARNRTLRDFVARARLPAGAIRKRDLVDAAQGARDVARADSILLFGNVATLNSYLEYGVDIRRIRVLNYATRPTVGLRAPRRPGPTRFLYLASEIGLRKGFDVLEHSLVGAAARGADFHLDLVGTPSHAFYERRIQELRARLAERVTWHGWLDAESAEYESVLNGADMVLAPSLEEGQAGSVLDAVAHGVIPIVSPAAGVDFAPIGHFAADLDSASNVLLIERACGLGEDELQRLNAQTLEYSRELHAGFREPLAAALAGAARGEPWPKVSVVLPIFNKERTVQPLLQLLDRSLSAYSNVDLHLILDGCVDGTEGHVREFCAADHNYSIRLSVTPDVFEVKSNNIGLREAAGAYGVILQDDNWVHATDFLFEAVTFMEKNRTAAVLGGLAGINVYPRGTSSLSGPGELVMEDWITYWRQDERADPSLRDCVFAVDTCIRGPLILRKEFLEAHGYLDEAYAPLCQDDLDLCMRAAARGFKVYCMLVDVVNDSGTMAEYSPEKRAWFDAIMQEHTDLFYSRWTPSLQKDYIRLVRTRLASLDRANSLAADGPPRRRRRWWIKARGGAP